MSGLTTEVYRVLQETHVWAAAGLGGSRFTSDDFTLADGGVLLERRRQRGGEGHESSDGDSEGVRSRRNSSTLAWEVSYVLQRGDLVEVWSDPDPNSETNIKNGRYARLTNGLGYIAMSDDVVQQVDIQRHPLTAFYVDNYPIGQCGLRQPVDRPEFRHSSSCGICSCVPTSTAADSGKGTGRAGRRRSRHHYVPGQLVFSNQSVQQGRTTFYRIQHASSCISHSTFNMDFTESVWLADSRPRSSTEEDPHDDVTLLIPYDKVQVNDHSNAPIAYQCLRTIELRTKPDVGNSSRSGQYLLRGDVCVASLVRQSPFTYGNGPFGLLRSGHRPLWCFERIRNGPPLLVPLDVERGDWTLQVRSHTALPVLRQPARQQQAPSSSPASPENHGTGTLGAEAAIVGVDATGSADVVRNLERNETVKCDARFESPSTGVWFYRVVGTHGSSDGNGGWVPDRSAAGRTLLVPVHDKSSLDEDFVDNYGNEEELGDDLPPWSMDFVRGVAAIASTTLREVSAQDDRRCMVFLQGTAMVHVFLATRTVEVEDAASHRAVQKRRCTPQQLSEILQNPVDALEIDHSNAAAPAEPALQLSHEEELKMRQQLVDCESELESILMKRRDLFEKLRLVEKWRRSEAVARLGMELEDVIPDSPHPAPGPLLSTPPDFGGVSSSAVLPEASEAMPSSTSHPQDVAVDEIPLVLAPRRSVLTWEDESPARPDDAAPETPEARSASLVASDTRKNGVRKVEEEEESEQEEPEEDEVEEEANEEEEEEEDGSLAMTPVIHNSSKKRSPAPGTSNDLYPLSAVEVYDHDKDDDENDRVKNGMDDDEKDRMKNGMDDDDLSSSDGTALSSVGEQLNRTCGVCQLSFETARLRSVHCLKAHGKFSCNYCPQVFDYVSLLHRHRDHENHW